ncbi:hypothetical protein EON65_06915, partial [archaeon]
MQIIQRQLNKEGLVDIVEDKEQVTCISTEELKQLFSCRASDTASDTHDTLRCSRCKNVATRTGNSNGKSMHSEQMAVCSRFWDGFVQQVMQESVAYQLREKKRAQVISGTQEEEVGAGEGVGEGLGLGDVVTGFPFQAHLDKLLAFLRTGEGVSLTVFSRKQREVVMEMDAELRAARDKQGEGGKMDKAKGNKKAEGDENIPNTEETGEVKGGENGATERERQLSALFPPSFSLFSEFIRQWTDLVPHLVTMTNKVPEGGGDGVS